MDKILLVEDDVMIASGLKYPLETEWIGRSSGSVISRF